LRHACKHFWKQYSWAKKSVEGGVCCLTTERARALGKKLDFADLEITREAAKPKTFGHEHRRRKAYLHTIMWSITCGSQNSQK
jgi:hypothetical protein